MKTPKPENRELVSASLKLLAMRDMSRLQFTDKLAKKEFTPNEIAEAVVWCEAEGWLNESRYADIMTRKLGYKYGASRIAQTLRQKGVNDEAIAESVANMQGSEFDRAQAVWSRKFDAPPIDAGQRTKQTRYLQSRGFGFGVIKRVLAGEQPDQQED